jgi:phage FluMu protein Com
MVVVVGGENAMTEEEPGLAKAVTEEEKEAKIYSEREKFLDEQREPVLDEPDYEYDNSDAICPKCKHHERQELCDFSRGVNDGDEWEWKCPECGSINTVVFSTSYSFTTRIKKPEAIEK